MVQVWGVDTGRVSGNVVVWSATGEVGGETNTMKSLSPNDPRLRATSNYELELRVPMLPAWFLERSCLARLRAFKLSAKAL